MPAGLGIAVSMPHATCLLAVAGLRDPLFGVLTDPPRSRCTRWSRGFGRN
jgi:hypothetical protein